MNNTKTRKNNLEERLIEFATCVIDFIENQPRRQAVILHSNQLIRSSTSVALNYGEAIAGESARDFTHKMKICLKELRETYMCLSILDRRPYVDSSKIQILLSENQELIKIFKASIQTVTRNKLTN